FSFLREVYPSCLDRGAHLGGLPLRAVGLGELVLDQAPSLGERAEERGPSKPVEKKNEAREVEDGKEQARRERRRLVRAMRLGGEGNTGKQSRGGRERGEAVRNAALHDRRPRRFARISSESRVVSPASAV